MPKISERTLGEHRTATVDRLLDAWAELIKVHGYADVSLADVAAQAGIARTAIYNYFPDREALLFTWTDREVKRTLSILEREIQEVPTCAEKLRIFVRLQLVDFANRHLPPGQEVVGFLRPETYGRFMEHLEPVERMLRGIIELGVSTGEFVTSDVAATIPMVMACIGAERGPVASRAHDVDEATERVTGFLLRALRPENASAPTRASKASSVKAGKPPARVAKRSSK